MDLLRKSPLSLTVIGGENKLRVKSSKLRVREKKLRSVGVAAWGEFPISTDAARTFNRSPRKKADSLGLRTGSEKDFLSFLRRAM